MKFIFIWNILKKWSFILKRDRYSCNKAATTCLVYKGETKKKMQKRLHRVSSFTKQLKREKLGWWPTLRRKSPSRKQSRKLSVSVQKLFFFLYRVARVICASSIYLWLFQSLAHCLSSTAFLVFFFCCRNMTQRILLV